jgi:hypothetical protein
LITGEFILIRIALLVARKPTNIPATLSVDEMMESLLGKLMLAFHQKNPASNPNK